MKVTKQILLANQAWAKELTDENPDFFTRQTAGQKPQFLWIGCSDSRVSRSRRPSRCPVACSSTATSPIWSMTTT